MHCADRADIHLCNLWFANLRRAEHGEVCDSEQARSAAARCVFAGMARGRFHFCDGDWTCRSGKRKIGGRNNRRTNGKDYRQHAVDFGSGRSFALRCSESYGALERYVVVRTVQHGVREEILEAVSGEDDGGERSGTRAGDAYGTRLRGLCAVQDGQKENARIEEETVTTLRSAALRDGTKERCFVAARGDSFHRL